MTYETIPFNTQTYSEQDPLGVAAIHRLEDEARDFAKNEYTTTFDVIACPDDVTVHEALPDELMYDKPAIVDQLGEVLVPPTSEIMGNGFKHSMVVRSMMGKGVDPIDWMRHSDMTVYWGDGESCSIAQLYNEHHDAETGNPDPTYITLSQLSDDYDNGGELRFVFQHTYADIGRYRVAVKGKDFFNIQMGDVLDDHGVTTRDVSLLCDIYGKDHLVSKNHLNHTRGAAISPLLVEVYAATPFPRVNNATRLFTGNHNLRFASGLFLKLQDSYSAREIFYNCDKLLATDYVLLNGTNTLSTSNTSAFSGCTLLGATFIDASGLARKVYLDDLVPANGFAESAFHSWDAMFSNCKSLSIKNMQRMARVFWDNQVSTSSGVTHVFQGCESMDLSMIPSTWGGTGTPTAPAPAIMVDSDTQGIMYQVQHEKFKELRRSNTRTGQFRSLAASDDVVVAASPDTGLYSSTDGMTWTKVVSEVGFAYVGFNGSDKFLAGQVVASASTAAAVMESTDGVNWTQHAFSEGVAPLGTCNYIEFDGTTTWFSTDKGLYKDDGTATTLVWSGKKCYATLRDGDLMLLGTEAGTKYSTDGGETFQNSNYTAKYIYGYKKFNDIYVSTGYGGPRWSTDGATWTNVSPKYSMSTIAEMDGELWQGSGSANIAYGLYHSTDGKVWKKYMSPPIQGTYFKSMLIFKGVYVIALQLTSDATGTDCGLWYCKDREDNSESIHFIAKEDLKRAINNALLISEDATTIDLSDQNAQKDALSAILKALGYTVTE